MELNANLFLLLALVASASCAPFGFGVGVGGKSHTTWGANAAATAGLEAGDDVLGIRGSARAGASLNTVKTLTGGAYVASKDGTGFGVGGTSVLDAGAEAELGGTGRAGLNTEEMKLFGETNGYFDRGAHADISGNLDFYGPDKLKNLVANGPRGSRTPDEPSKATHFHHW